MPDKHCSVEACKESPIVVCNCEVDPIAMCENHLHDHSCLARNHSFISITSEINENSRISVIKLFLKLKSDINTQKLQVIHEELSLVQQIHKVTENTLKKLKIHDKKLTEIISELNTLREIDNSKPMSFIETLLLNDSLLINKIKPPKLQIKHIGSDKIAELFNVDPKEETFDFSKFYCPTTHVIKFHCSEEKTGKLCIFDAETLKINKIACNRSREHGFRKFRCLLPNGSILFSHRSSSFIVDPIGNTRNFLMPTKYEISGAIYLGGEIYIFGYSKGKSVKFNIIQNRWVTFSKNPLNDSDDVSCVLFKNKILMASSHKLMYYDIIVDSYSEILQRTKLLSNSHNKLFFVKNEKVILFDYSGFVYESYDDLLTWNKIGNCKMMSNGMIGNHICYKDAIYIATQGFIYSFNLASKKTIKVATFKFIRDSSRF